MQLDNLIRIILGINAPCTLIGTPQKIQVISDLGNGVLKAMYNSAYHRYATPYSLAEIKAEAKKRNIKL